MNGSYRTTREPLRDWKFAKSSRVLRKRSRDKLNLRGWVLPHMRTRAQILGNAGFYAGPTDDALNKQIQAENEVYEERHDPARLFQIWVLPRPLFSIGKLRHRILKVIENTSWDIRWLHFWKQDTQVRNTFSNVTWQRPTTPCVHSTPRGIGQTAHQQQNKTGQMVPKYGS